MDRAQCAMLWVSFMLLGVVGCRHLPDLKPPPEPEVLASPGPDDKRYTQPSVYPPETLANDPSKAGLNGTTPAGGKRGGGASMTGSGMAGPGGGF